MTNRKIYGLIFLSILYFCCKDDPVTSDNPLPPDPNKSNANHLILNQVRAGDSGKVNVILDLYPTNGGNFICSGIENNQYALKEIDKTGGTLWITGLPFQPRSIYRFSADNPLFPDGYMVTGAVPYSTVIGIYGNGGSAVKDNYISKPGKAIWLNSVEIISSHSDSCKFIGCGGIQAQGSFVRPCIALLTLHQDGSVGTDTIITFDSPYRLFCDICIDRDSAGVSYYLSGVSVIDDTIAEYAHIFKISDSMRIVWNDYFRPSGTVRSETGLNQLFEHNNDLIILGNCLTEKQPDSQSTGLWGAGMAVSYSKSGTMNWLKTYILSDYGDEFTSGFIDGDYIYVAGLSAGGRYTLSDLHFGLALLSKIDMNSGEAPWHMKFGEDSYQSLLNGIYIESNRAYCGGYTEFYTSSAGTRSWFADVDINNPPLSKTAVFPILKMRAGTPEQRSYPLKYYSEFPARAGKSFLKP